MRREIPRHAAGPATVPLRPAEPEVDPGVLLRRGAALVRDGRTDEALALYAGLARAQPRSEVPRLAAGEALLRADRLDEGIRELEAAARLAARPAAILGALARLYLDPRIGRPGDALAVARSARRLEPWREEVYYLQARAHESLGQQEAARQAYRVLLANFPSGEHAQAARRGLEALSRAHYEVTLDFRFVNRGPAPADHIRFRVQAAQDFPPYSQARVLELPEGAEGRELADGTRYFSFEPFALAPGAERTLRIRYAVAVAAESYASVSPEGGEDVARFLAAAPFIESDAVEIRSLAQSLAPEATPARERARRFYDFVLQRLSYVVQTQTQGALGALANPEQADCTEFAALFIALSRAAGIPARPVFGYLYEPDRPRYEISHLWAEFWDERGWVTVDPTNGSLEPDRYFARVESQAIPLWVPAPDFGDLAGVRVSYRSPGVGDPLFTELVAGIRRIPTSEFESVEESEIAFLAAASDGRGWTGDLPAVPAAALLTAAFGFRAWHRRARSV